MPTIMNMPKIGVNMTEAVIVEWIAKEGDTVREGDHILDAETDKAVQEIYSPVSGVLQKILEPVGSEVLCQAPIAVFLLADEKPEGDAAGAPAANAAQAGVSAQPAAEPKPVQAVPVPMQAAVHETSSTRKKISPLAKKLARDMSIDSAALQPTEPATRIVKADVLAYASAKAPINKGTPEAAPPVGTSVAYSGTRKRIGDRMTESWQTKPAVALTLHANAERLIEWRESLKKAGKPAGYNELFALIVSRVLREQPMINSRFVGNAIEQLPGIHIGVAVDTEKGLVVPVIRHADKKSLLEIGADFRSKVEAVRAGKATAEDLSGSTFTITNLGMYEIESFTPVINPPECCILGLGAIVREPVVDEHDKIVIQSRLQMTLVFDHRIVDGAPAAKFLQRVKHLVQCPMDLMS